MSVQKENLLKKLSEKFMHVDPMVLDNNSLKSLRFLLKAVDFYKIDMSNTILAFNGVNATSQDRSNQYYKLFLSKNLNGNLLDFVFSQFVILHELRHIIQMQNKWLVNKSLFQEWNKDGEEFKFLTILIQFTSVTDYNLLPWEFDANKFAVNSELLDPSFKERPEMSSVIELTKGFHFSQTFDPFNQPLEE